MRKRVQLGAAQSLEFSCLCRGTHSVVVQQMILVRFSSKSALESRVFSLFRSLSKGGLKIPFASTSLLNPLLVFGFEELVENAFAENEYVLLH